MKKLLIPACYLLGTMLVLSSCSNEQKNSNETAHHEHDGHGHAQEPTTTTTAPVQKASLNEQPAPALTIPAFTFYKVKSGMAFTNNDIPKGKKTAFILFDPSCGHCQTEAAALGKNYNKIKDINIYFISMNDPALQASFLETFAKELVNKPNVEVLYDKNQEFIQKVHIPKQFPANYVYGVDGKLQTSWDGDRNINDIIAAYTK